MMLLDAIPRGVEPVLQMLGAWAGIIWVSTLSSVAPLIWWFFVFVSVDILTGIWAASKQHTLSFSAFANGMVKKGIAFAIIILAHGLDVSFWYVLHDLPLFQSITLCAYCCGEFASVVENVCHAGYSDALPPVLRKLFLRMEHRLESVVDSHLEKLGLVVEGDSDESHVKPNNQLPVSKENH